jgi:hypothetical protein
VKTGAATPFGPARRPARGRATAAVKSPASQPPTSVVAPIRGSAKTPASAPTKPTAPNSH